MKERDLINQFPDKDHRTDYGPDDPQETKKLMIVVSMVVSAMSGIVIGMVLMGFINWLRS